MSSLPLGASNSPSLPSQIRGGGGGGGVERVGNIGMVGERDRNEQRITEGAVSTALKVGGEKWGWKDKGWG